MISHTAIRSLQVKEGNSATTSMDTARKETEQSSGLLHQPGAMGDLSPAQGSHISILAPQGRWTPIKTHTPTHHSPAITSPKSQPALAPLTPNPYQRGGGFARTPLPFKKGAEGGSPEPFLHSSVMINYLPWQSVKHLASCRPG